MNYITNPWQSTRPINGEFTKDNYKMVEQMAGEDIFFQILIKIKISMKVNIRIISS